MISAKSCAGGANSSSVQRITRPCRISASGSVRLAQASCQREMTNSSGAAVTLPMSSKLPGTLPIISFVSGARATSQLGPKLQFLLRNAAEPRLERAC